jgi:hypothetical protein
MFSLLAIVATTAATLLVESNSCVGETVELAALFAVSLNELAVVLAAFNAAALSPLGAA